MNDDEADTDEAAIRAKLSQLTQELADGDVAVQALRRLRGAE